MTNQHKGMSQSNNLKENFNFSFDINDFINIRTIRWYFGLLLNPSIYRKREKVEGDYWYNGIYLQTFCVSYV